MIYDGPVHTECPPTSAAHKIDKPVRSQFYNFVTLHYSLSLHVSIESVIYLHYLSIGISMTLY